MHFTTRRFASAVFAVVVLSVHHSQVGIVSKPVHTEQIESMLSEQGEQGQRQRLLLQILGVVLEKQCSPRTLSM